MIRMLTGDCREVLATLDAGSVQCVVTSPPYYGLRSYGVGAENGEIGSEATPDEYLATMVRVFREVRRVLREDGVCFVNMGDSYASGVGMARDQPYQRHAPQKSGLWKGTRSEKRDIGNDGAVKDGTGLKPKDLLLMPARLALALQADGWWIRSDIIWAKPNPMPESVTDRPTSAHEHVFLLTKSARYFYDADAVREPSVSDHPSGNGYARPEQLSRGGRGQAEGWTDVGGGRNMRNVWTIATHAYPDAHFATFPPELAERCIKAGTSERGCCAACGAPWVRVVERGDLVPTRKNHDMRAYGVVVDAPDANDAGRNRARDGHRANMAYETTTTGWAPSCEHDVRCQRMGCRSSGRAPALVNDVCPRCGTRQEKVPVPCTVLDPFAGAGTTLLVADRLQRHAIGIELNPAYAAMTTDRVRDDAGLFAEIAAE